MEVPFNAPLRCLEAQRKETEAAIQTVLDSGWYLLGPKLKDFESELAAYLGVAHALGCNSGTDALVLGLKALGVNAGDEVILPAHTAVPTVTATIAAGGTPVFCDIDPETWLLDSNQAKKLVTKKTKAVVPVHLYGNMADMDAFLELGVPVLEDVAQAFGATYKNKQAGSIGSIGAHSFYPTKNLAALGDGGGISTGSAELAEKMRMLRFYGQKDRYMALVEGGINSRLDEIQAAVLSVRLKKISEWVRERGEIMAYYRKTLQGLPLCFQKVTDFCTPAWHLAVVRLDDKKLRDPLLQYLANKKIGTLVHYPTPNHLQPAFASHKKTLPETEALCSRILSLPLYPGLVRQELESVAEAVKGFFRG